MSGFRNPGGSVARRLLLAAVAVPAIHWVAAGSALGVSPVGPGRCQPPQGRQAALALDFEAFDQGGSGWRSLEDRGCDRAAAALIRTYAQGHSDSLRPSDLAILYFHQAQMLAGTGARAGAVDAISRSRAATARQPRRFASWDLYVDGTEAWLRRDRNALRRAIGALAAAADGLAGPAQQAAQLNLATLRGLDRCFRRSYRVAYSPKCSVGRPAIRLPTPR